jgi:hypothetical protein
MRFVNFLVICALIMSAAAVYKIKFDSTLRAERVAKLRNELRDERNAIAALRAEWSALDNPGRIQGLADRHLALKPIQPAQYDELAELPERSLRTPNSDPIGSILAPRDPHAFNGVSAQAGR